MNLLFDRCVASLFAVVLATTGADPSRTLSAQGSSLTPQARRLAGCYVARLGPWSGPPRPSEAQTPPSEFELDTLPVQRRGESRLTVRPMRLAQYSRIAYWTPRGDDSVAIVWSTGFVGVKLQLVVRQDSLIGGATTFHDFHPIGEPPDPTALVVAVRRACQMK